MVDVEYCGKGLLFSWMNIEAPLYQIDDHEQLTLNCITGFTVLGRFGN